MAPLAPPPAPPVRSPRHLYLHFPFCSGRCRYCAFVSGPPPADVPGYIQSLVAEARARGFALPLGPLDSLYCGGGTPGLIGEAGFRALAQSGLFTLARGAEWSVELHPATVSEGLVATLAELGVTRLSIGVQSFDEATLVRCNRRHTVPQALEAIARARAAIPDTGIDLIAGLPGLSPALWRQTLRRALALDLPHLSIYALSIEPGSAWARAPEPDPDALCNAIALAARALPRAGYARYETSNYARPGFRCRHNLNTWHGGDYLGLGRGAASRLGLERRDGAGHCERLAPLDDQLERALSQLRLDEGFDLGALCARFPRLAPLRGAWQTCLASAQRHGLLNARFAPTLRGYEVLDALQRDLLAALV